jgi:glycerophosphoryl diester phosphodiesterase
MKYIKGLVIVILLAVVVIGAYFALRPEPDYSSTQAHSGWIISHKTAGLEYPENTVEGFEASLAMPVDAIELDVHLVKEGRFVLHHDPVLSDYNCFPKGDDTRIVVAQQTVEQLEALDCLNHKVKDQQGNSTPYKIVSLERFLEIYQASDQNKALLLEIKVWDELIENNPLHVGLDISTMHYPDEEVATAIYRTLRQYPEITNIQFNTFGRDLLLRLKAMKQPDEPYDFGLLYKGSYDPVAMAIPAFFMADEGCYDFCWVPDYEEARAWVDANGISTFIPEFTQVSTWPFSSDFEENIMANKGDLRVIPWTLNEPKTWSAYEKQDFDGILTDTPTEFREWAGE